MGKHREATNGDIVGTPTFLSLDCHFGITHARKDDIEGLLYVLIYTLKGELPWQNAKNNSEGAEIKQRTSLDQLCEGIDSQWTNMLQYIRKCRFDEKPNYKWLRECLKSSM